MYNNEIEKKIIRFKILRVYVTNVILFREIINFVIYLKPSSHVRDRGQKKRENAAKRETDCV